MSSRNRASRLTYGSSMLPLLLGSLVAIIASASASPTQLSAISTNPGAANRTKMFTAEDLHANVMSKLSPEKITTSSEFKSSDFLSRHASLNTTDERTFYLSDTRSWITLDGPVLPTVENDTLNAREFCPPTTERALLFAHSYWSPWQHMTACSFSGKGEGGSVYYSEEQSISTTHGGGISGDWSSIISLGFDFSVSEEHGIATGYYCNFGPNDAAQVWGRHVMGWAQVRQRACNACGVCYSTTVGFVDSPAAGDGSWSQFGCTTSAAGGQLRC